MGSGEPAAAQPERLPSSGKWRARLLKALKFLTIFGLLLILGKIDLFGTSGATAIHSERIFYQVYSTFLGDEELYGAEETDSDERRSISVQDITVLLITDAGLGEREGWPPSFKYHRRNLIRIAKQEPRAIFIDIVFRQTKDLEGAAAFGNLIRNIANGDLTSGKKIKVYLAATDIRPLKRPPLDRCNRDETKMGDHKSLVPPIGNVLLATLMGLDDDADWDEAFHRYMRSGRSGLPERIELVSVQSAGFYRRGIEYQATDLWNNRRTAAVALYEDATGSHLTVPACAEKDFEEATFEIAWATRDLSNINWPWSVDRSEVIETFEEDEKDGLLLNPPQYYDCRSSTNVAGEALEDNAVWRTAAIVWYHFRQAVRGVIPFLDEELPRPENSPPWTNTTADVLLRETCPPHLTMPDYDILQVGRGYFTEPTESDVPRPSPPLAGRFIFYGAATQVAADMIEPPTHEPLPGVYLHAMAFETLLRTNGKPVGLSKRDQEHSGYVFAAGLFLLLLASEAFDWFWDTHRKPKAQGNTIALLISLALELFRVPLVVIFSSVIALLTLAVGFGLFDLRPTNFLGLFGLLLIRRLPNLRTNVDICLGLVCALWLRLVGFVRGIYCRFFCASPHECPPLKWRRRRRPRVILQRYTYLQRTRGARL